MKQGDLVRLLEISFPQYKGMLGILGDIPPDGPNRPPGVSYTNPCPEGRGRWIVFIDNRWHPFIVDESCLELVNEAR